MNKGIELANYFLGEASTLAGTPGTDIIRNDYAEKVFPHGFTSDTTVLTPKEIIDTIVFMTSVEPRLLRGYVNQVEDNIETLKELKQMNRVADLQIRLFMANFALENTDFLSKYQGTTEVTTENKETEE